MPKLRGTRALLRPYRREDQQEIAAWANDPDTTRYLSDLFVRPYTEKNAEDFINMMLAGNERHIGFVIADPETEEYLGQIDLMNISWQSRRAMIGIVLAQERSRGRGVGCDAMRLLCDYAFQTLGLNRLALDVYADNARARACYRKAGFVQEGVAREHTWCDGKFADMVQMSMLRRDWEKLREGERHV